MYYLYMVKCADGTFYTGITTDITRRVSEHNCSPKGARYTRSRRPVQCVYTCSLPDKTTALREEIRIKRLSHERKHALAVTRGD
ncbi:MAG: GIY-YIG nuclease family protein [Candidatus Pacebacteria bacterium]|nr:GIY-YIG nuclease family protein [Candidatus Paceibacterota bacterium]